MNYHGQYAEKLIPHTIQIESTRSTRKLSTRVMLNAYINCIVVDIMSQVPADEANGIKRSTTLRIAVASALQTRRITGFGDMADALAKLVPGTVIEAYGNGIRSTNGSGVQNPAFDGMEVIELYVISNEAYKKAFNEDLPLVQMAQEEKNRLAGQNTDHADISDQVNTEHVTEE